MRAIWTGALSFGLINIPVRLYSATTSQGLDLDMLHKKDLSPIRYARVCRTDGREIPWEDVVKGYEYNDGDYVVLTDEDFKKANVRKTKTVDIEDFTDEKQIDPIYYEKPYYLEPDKGATKAYGLLLYALKKAKKVGVAKFVIRNKEHLGIIRPFKKVLLLNQLRYKSEIRPFDELDLPTEEKTKSREVDMALKLINQLTATFKPEQYKDTYTEELKEVIKQKAKGKKPKAKGKEPEPTEVTDIMAMLKASLEEHHREREKEKVR